MQEQIVVLGQMAHLARDMGSDEPLFAEVPSEMLGFKLCLDCLQAAVKIIDLSIKGMVSVNLCNEVPLIQIVNSCAEDGIMGLGTPKHVSEPGG
jgi:hypothetical protein